jgi:hypothetical protein
VSEQAGARGLRIGDIVEVVACGDGEAERDAHEGRQGFLTAVGPLKGQKGDVVWYRVLFGLTACYAREVRRVEVPGD